MKPVQVTFSYSRADGAFLLDRAIFIGGTQAQLDPIDRNAAMCSLLFERYPDALKSSVCILGYTELSDEDHNRLCQ